MDNQNSAHITKGDDALVIELKAPPQAGSQAFWFALLLIPVGISLKILHLWWNSPRAHFSWLIAVGLLGLLAWYFFRLLLWSRGGGEIIGIKRGRMRHYSNYKLFRLGERVYPYGELEVSFYRIDSRGGTDGTNDLLDDLSGETDRGLLFIQLDSGKTVETSVDIPYTEFRRIRRAVDDYFSPIKRVDGSS